MVRKPELHGYSDRPPFNRLLLLIATLIQHPGVGSADPLESSSGEHHEALQDVWERMQHVAASHALELEPYRLSTLKKDLQFLRRYGILHRSMYRWGYYLGTGVFQSDELAIALQALAAQGGALGDCQSRQVFESVTRRLRSRNSATQGRLMYPIRTQLNRSIVPTDPQEMMRKGENQHTLFHQLQPLEQAIAQGQRILLYRHRDPHGTQGIGTLDIYPLQLIYSEIAWYLIYEYAEDSYLEIERMDRLSDSLKIVTAEGRGIEPQKAKLDQAYQLLTHGWGLYLGKRFEQQQELAGTLPLILVKVRFFPPVAQFILEAKERHPQQALRINKTHGYVDYSIHLPRRSLEEFRRWISRFMEGAMFLEPKELAYKHQQAAKGLIERYQSETQGNEAES